MLFQIKSNNPNKFKVSRAVSKSNQIEMSKQNQGITYCWELYNESSEEAKEASGNLLSPNIVIDTAIVIIASQWSVESSISHYVIGVTV